MTLMQLHALLLALVPALLAQPDRFGFPSCSAQDHELAPRTFFTLCYNSSRKVASWVGYELKPEHLRPVAVRPHHFRHDPQLASPRAYNLDYKFSGFSRGHLAPAADFLWSSEAIRATFLLSNAVPQHQRANAGRWSQLEAAVRRIAATSDAVYVFTGTLFESAETEVIGPGEVAVPSHTFKVVLVVQGERKRMYAAIVPNVAKLTQPLDTYVTTVNEVERRSGLDFFSELEDSEEHQLESGREALPK